MAAGEETAAAQPRQNIEPADDLAVGILPTCKQAISDLFVWKKRVVISNEYGETRCEWHENDKFVNPFSLLAMLSAKGWLFFTCGFVSWTADAFDFHALSIQQVKLAAYYDTSKTQISTAITLTLLLRSIGAAAFGLAGDKWGRKWPMVVNMVVLGVLQPSTVAHSPSSLPSVLSSVYSWVVSTVTPLPWLWKRLRKSQNALQSWAPTDHIIAFLLVVFSPVFFSRVTPSVMSWLPALTLALVVVLKAGRLFSGLPVSWNDKFYLSLGLSI